MITVRVGALMGPCMGPYGPIYGPIWAHMGPYGPIRAHMDPYMGPTPKHHVLKPTLAAADEGHCMTHYSTIYRHNQTCMHTYAKVFFPN